MAETLIFQSKINIVPSSTPTPTLKAQHVRPRLSFSSLSLSPPPPRLLLPSWQSRRQSLIKATTHAEAGSSNYLCFVGLVNSQAATIRTPPRSSPALGPWGIASSPRTLEAVAAAKNTQNLSIKRLRINTPHTHTHAHTHTQGTKFVGWRNS